MDTHRYLVVRGKGGLENRLLALAKILDQVRGDDPRLLVEWNDRYYSDSPSHNAFPAIFDLRHPAAAGPKRSVDIPGLNARRIIPICWKGGLHEEVYGNVDIEHRWTGAGESPGYRRP